MTKDTNGVSRRKVITSTGVLAVTGLAGCSGGGEGTTTTSGDGGGGNTTTTKSGASSMKPIELLHAWSGGDGKRAIKALIEGFQEKHPDIKFAEEPVNGAARSNLDQVVQNRLQANDPPSTFQTWPGKTLKKFGQAYADIEGSVWDKEMKNNYRKGPRKQAQLEGTYVTVPINIHRINNLFYNVDVVKKAGVDPTNFSSPSDLVDACKKIASDTDAVPFAHQTSGAWSTGQLWGTTLLAVGGASGYSKYINGNGSKKQVSKALEHIIALKEYYPQNSSSIGFTEANKMVMEGKAAFIHQGDWAAGAYSGKSGFDYKKNWNQVPYPGTSGNYQLNMDSFPYFDNNPSPKATKVFLRYCGSTDAQIKFNKEKGSIPPREDADVSKLNKFQQDQFDDFTSSDNQPPSIQHGLAVVPEVQSNFGEAMSAFIESYNTEKTAKALMGAFN